MNQPLTVLYAGGEGPGSIDASEVITGSGNGSVDNQWRIRGPTNAGGGGDFQSNGWNSAVAQYTQGALFAANTTGYTNLSMTFGWFVTTQGVADLMVRESSNGGATWTNVLATPLEQTTAQGTINTAPAVYTVSLATGTNDVELVSAYHPILGTTYASATTAAAGDPTVINNSSGNWRSDYGTAGLKKLAVFLTEIANIPVLSCTHPLASGNRFPSRRSTSVAEQMPSER